MNDFKAYLIQEEKELTKAEIVLLKLRYPLLFCVIENLMLTAVCFS